MGSFNASEASGVIGVENRLHEQPRISSTAVI